MIIRSLPSLPAPLSATTKVAPGHHGRNLSRAGEPGQKVNSQETVSSTGLENSHDAAVLRWRNGLLSWNQDLNCQWKPLAASQARAGFRVPEISNFVTVDDGKLPVIRAFAGQAPTAPAAGAATSGPVTRITGFFQVSNYPTRRVPRRDRHAGGDSADAASRRRRRCHTDSMVAGEFAANAVSEPSKCSWNIAQTDKPGWTGGSPGPGTATAASAFGQRSESRSEPCRLLTCHLTTTRSTSDRAAGYRDRDSPGRPVRFKP